MFARTNGARVPALSFSSACFSLFAHSLRCRWAETQPVPSNLRGRRASSGLRGERPGAELVKDVVGRVWREIGVQSSAVVSPFVPYLLTDNLKRLTMSNKQATGNDKNHGRLFRFSTIYFLMLKNKSTTKIQTLLTDRKLSHLWMELIQYFTLF